MNGKSFLIPLLAILVALQGCPGDGGGGGGGSGGSAFGISTTTAPFGIVGNNYSATLTTNGGTAPFTWMLFGGALPAGLNLNAGTGAITGIPTAAGNSTATFMVRDSTGSTAMGSVLLAIHTRTDRVSIAGTGIAGNGASSEPVINSGDGRFIAFTSLATNLTPLPGGSGSQVFLHDRQSNLPSLISQDNLGNAGNGASNQPSVSGDGRFVAFTSAATNPAPAAGGSGTQIFLRDTQTNQTILVSRDALGNVGNGASSQPAISDDGRFVAFTSAATNLASVVGGSGTQIFLRDTQGNQTILVSQDTLGNAGNGASSQPAISSDGRFVVFTSAAALASTPGGSGTQIFLRDTQSNQTSLVSRDTLGNAGDG
ncbi:MAG TPA: putative Ig domain-containing protein, partial [Nitrospira sp.]|nr:putative Ig domain-containing protein [Nitrospira sp.]